MKEQILEIAKDVEQGIITETEAQNLLLCLFGVSGSLYDAPKEIWVNIYYPIKPNSWDIYNSEKSAVINSIGAKTHRYMHESLLHNVLHIRRQGLELLNFQLRTEVIIKIFF